ncbi:MAG: S1/P1 nuclease [Flavisolibacter sp.]
MRKRSLTALFFLFIFSYLPLSSHAWGMLGHRIVGEIASDYLTPRAKAEIKKILGNESIAMASNWADFIRSDTSYRYLSTWHYVDFQKGISFQEMQEVLKKDSSADAYTKLHFLGEELKKKNLSREKKLLYLRLLIHIAEDLSQPLHVSPVGSSGGNDIKVTWFSTPSNLHRIWDEDLIEYQKLSYTEYARAINFPSDAQKKIWISQTPVQWLYDSYTIAQDLLNNAPEQNARLSYDYNFRHVSTLNQQLLKGGIRLAGLLNQIFK